MPVESKRRVQRERRELCASGPEHRDHLLHVSLERRVGRLGVRGVVGVYLDPVTALLVERCEQRARAGRRVEHWGTPAKDLGDEPGGLGRREVLLEADKGVLVAAGVREHAAAGRERGFGGRATMQIAAFGRSGPCPWRGESRSRSGIRDSRRVEGRGFARRSGQGESTSFTRVVLVGLAAPPRAARTGSGPHEAVTRSGWRGCTREWRCERWSLLQGL